MLLWEQVAPSHVGKGGFAPIMRLSCAIAAGGGFYMFYQRSVCETRLFLSNFTKGWEKDPGWYFGILGCRWEGTEHTGIDEC